MENAMTTAGAAPIPNGDALVSNVAKPLDQTQRGFIGDPGAWLSPGNVWGT